MLTIAVSQTGLGGYLVLFAAVAASWVGIPIVGAGVLAAAGVLASEGEMSIWLVILVASVGAWSGGYIGYLVGRRAGIAIADVPGPLHHRRRRLMHSGRRVYHRWGRLAVFVTPTFVSGALRMPLPVFLRWNVAAATLSSAITALGAYGVGAAVIGQLASRQGVLALVGAGLLTLVAVLLVRRRRRAASASTPEPARPSGDGGEQRRVQPLEGGDALGSGQIERRGSGRLRDQA